MLPRGQLFHTSEGIGIKATLTKLPARQLIEMNETEEIRLYPQTKDSSRSGEPYTSWEARFASRFIEGARGPE
jgi:hypothetical protein